ncbi:hypothetical protein ALP63_02030 [Pseudomonas syringae pv. aceris]|uniref:hypothetical protein n=1 Tax=Pseudomonas syringae TaxID=317 RepID=UPI000F00920C|nr:hypothetical protein [Pseudomonas syringae]RMS64556.1 hypothetical protein ALP63_02030 [Pseudomonas syringae pv. aceris]RMS68140.1 hypothetical protein ALP62_03152 [Pseudomonas syringae pv. aceris]
MKIDNEYISLHIESAASKLRAELLKENMDLRRQLEDLRLASTVLLSEVNSKISNAEDRVTEKAIDKTLGIVSQVKNWIAVVAVFITVVSGLGVFIGYNNLSNTLTALFNSKVTQWMQFDDDKSGGRQALDELRTEAIVNAYMIRLARNYSSISESLFPLNGPEEKRLLKMLQAPETKYAEFSDALTIIVKNRGPFRLALSEDDVGRRIATLLNASEISPDKKGLILQKLKGDAALLPYSRSILNDENLNIYVRLAALENIKVFDKDMAISFVKRNVNKVKAELKGALVLYLAKESGEYSNALGYVREIVDQKPEYWQSSVLEIVSGLGETFSSKSNLDLEGLADLISEVAKLGGQIEISDERFGPKRIAIQLDGASTMMAKPGRLLKNQDLIKSVILKNGDDVASLLKSAQFFQISDQETLLTTLIVRLNDKACIETESKALLTETNVSGDVWLRVQSVPGGKQLIATWRDPETGIVHADPVNSVSHLGNMRFSLSFDEKLMESLSYDYHSPTDLL